METAADSSASPPPYEEERLGAVIQETVEYNLGFAVSEDVLRERLAMAEAAERELREKIYFFANRLQQAHQRINQKKGEAILNAQALRKYVMENQKIKEQYTVVCNEVARLERECALYFHDREVFMEAAEEAEERAQNAERHVRLADDRIKELRSQIEVLNDRMTQLSATNQKMAEELNGLRNTVKEFHSHSRSLCSKSNLSGQCETDGFLDSRVEQLERENKRLRAALEIKYSGAEKRLHESEDSRIEKKGCFSKDRSLLVSSVVAEVLNNATEQEKEEAISKISSSIDLCVEEFKSELLGRLETSENKVKLLQVEVESLVQERNKIKSNLEVAEDEVQLLDEQNKELRLLLHSKQQTAESFSSPLQTKVMSLCSPKLHIRASEPISDNENDCRQPLLPLSQNLV